MAATKLELTQGSIASRRAEKVAEKEVPQNKVTEKSVAEKKASTHPAVAIMNDEEALAKMRDHYKEKYVENWRLGRGQRFSSDQVAILTAYFEQEPTWDFQKKLEIAQKLGLYVCQVKKWNFDQRKRKGHTSSAKGKNDHH